MRRDYTQVFQDDAAAAKYDWVVYQPGSYSSDINARQRRWLRALVRHHFPEPPVQHDFACGTGRAIAALAGLVEQAHGYDTSAQMLNQARAAGIDADLWLVPDSDAQPRQVRSTAPALVTVFRLLLNSPQAVRDTALRFATAVLDRPEDGLLLLENHGNLASVRHLSRSRHTGNAWFAELSHEEVVDLLDRYGFDVVERRGFALLPPGAYARRWLRPLARRCDDLASRIGLLAGVCVNVVYVARRR